VAKLRYLGMTVINEKLRADYCYHSVQKLLVSPVRNIKIKI
jgi:hypothetical protein